MQGRADAEEEWDGEVTFEVPTPEEAAAAPSSTSEGKPPPSPGDTDSAAQQQQQQQSRAEARERAAAAAKLRAAQAELAVLKQRIQGREQRIAKEQARRLWPPVSRPSRRLLAPRPVW